MRKKTFQDRNLGAASWRDLKRALVRAMRTRERSHRGRTLGLLGHSLESEASRVVRTGSWPTSRRPICLQAEGMAVW